MKRSLWSGFSISAQRFPERPAVMVDGRALTYADLYQSARRIASTIQAYSECCSSQLTAVFAYRSSTAFAAILGSLLAGNGYVPLNKTYPIKRTRTMFERSGANSIIVDEGSLPQLEGLLDITRSLLILLPDHPDAESFRRRWPAHTFVATADFRSSAEWQPSKAGDDDVAYLLFTSGSTGTPKGVAVSHKNVLSFLDYMVDHYAVNEDDRFSQMFDMTFDLSVFDMFVPWQRGATVCCASQKTLINPGRFIQDLGLTVWFSVPSTAVFMSQLGALKPNQYPSLRLSLFCGEPLPLATATAWATSAPHSVLENLYGPTELTIACTRYHWNPALSPSECEIGVVPIGTPYPGMDVLIVNQDLGEVGVGEDGELLMTGPQMSLGYWKDPERTAAAFIIPPGRKEVFYRTGDRVPPTHRRRSAHASWQN